MTHPFSSPHGPYTLGQIKNQAGVTDVKGETLCRQDCQPDWMPVKDQLQKFSPPPPVADENAASMPWEEFTFGGLGTFCFVIGCLLILFALFLCIQPGESAPTGLWLTASGFAIAVERLAKK